MMCRSSSSECVVLFGATCAALAQNSFSFTPMSMLCVRLKTASDSSVGVSPWVFENISPSSRLSLDKQWMSVPGNAMHIKLRVCVVDAPPKFQEDSCRMIWTSGMNSESFAPGSHRKGGTDVVTAQKGKVNSTTNRRMQHAFMALDSTHVVSSFFYNDSFPH